MLKTRDVDLKLNVKVYYDGKFEQEDLRKKLMETLETDRWDCTLEIENIGAEQIYKG